MADDPQPDSAILAAIDRIRVLELRPDDVLVITCPVRLSQHVADLIRRRIREGLDHRPVLVLDSGMDVAVIRPEDVKAASE